MNVAEFHQNIEQIWLNIEEQLGRKIAMWIGDAAFGIYDHLR